MKKIVYTLVTTMMAFGLNASPETNVQVESRPLTHIERMAIHEAHAQEPAESEFEFSLPQASVHSSNVSSTYNSVHPGAYHWLFAVTPYGEQITTEDGTVWATYPGDRYKLLQWSTTESLTIIQNTSPYSNYMFTIVNRVRDQSVDVNMVLGPKYKGPYTYWIIGINAGARKVILNDNSVWDMSRFDDEVYSKWFLDDAIIIGVNDGTLTSFNPNILINVNTLTYARGSLD